MALLNTFNGYHFLPVFPNWDNPIKHTLRVSGEEEPTLRGNEERIQFREGPRAILEFEVWPGTLLEAQSITDIKRFCLDQNQGKVCVPYWVRPAIINATANAGATSIVIDTAAALCPAFLTGDVIFVPNPLQDGTYFTRTLTSVTVSGTTLNFSGGTPFNVGPLDRVYGLHSGRLEPDAAEQFDGNTATEIIRVAGETPARAPFAGTPPLFGARPVFDMPLDWNDAAQSTQVYNPRLAEIGAQVVDEAMQKFVVNSFYLPRDCWSRAEISQIELLFRAAFGTQQGFWLPEAERWAAVAAAVDPTHFDVPGRGLIETFATEPGATAYVWAVDQEPSDKLPFTNGLVHDWDARYGAINNSGLPAQPGDAVLTLKDATGSTVDPTQASGTSQPIFRANIFNGLPALQFDGVDDGMISAGVPTYGGGDFTIFAVLLPDAATAINSIFCNCGPTNGTAIAIRNSPTVASSWGAKLGASTNYLTGANGVPTIISASRTGTTATVGRDNARLAGTSGTPIGGASQSFGITSYKGYATRLVVFNRLLSEAEVSTIERRLAIIYGLTTPSRGLQVTAVATAGSNERCTVPLGNYAVTPSDDLMRLRYSRFADTEILFEHDTEDTCRASLNFVEVPHEYAAVDLGQRRAWLYRITRPSIGPVYWTSYDQSITALSQTFVPAPIEHDTISESIDGDDNAVQLTTWRAAAGTPFAQPAPFATGEEILVEIFSYDMQSLAAPTLEWIGAVDQITIIGRKLLINCATRLNRMGNILPRWRVQRRCNTQLYSATCGISRASRVRNPVVTVVSQAGRLLRLNLTGIGSLAASYHVYGEVKSLAEYRQIEAVTVIDPNNIDVRLEHPFAVDPVVGIAVETAEGCDLSPEACTNQYGNLVNFRGHPKIDENLALKAIELRTSGGKK